VARPPACRVFDIGQRIVGPIHRQPVGAGQVLEPEAGLAIVAAWPLDAVRAQRMGQPQQVDQVEAAVAVAEFTRVGVDEVAPEQESGHLVIEAEAVVANRTGAGPAHQLEDLLGKAILGQAALACQLRRDAGDQAGLGRRQQIGGRLTVQHHWLADRRQLCIGAQRGELAGAIPTRIGTEGLVVMPQEAVRVHVAIVPPRRSMVARSFGGAILRF